MTPEDYLASQQQQEQQDLAAEGQQGYDAINNQVHMPNEYMSGETVKQQKLAQYQAAYNKKFAEHTKAYNKRVNDLKLTRSIAADNGMDAGDVEKLAWRAAGMPSDMVNQLFPDEEAKLNKDIANADKLIKATKKYKLGSATNLATAGPTKPLEFTAGPGRVPGRVIGYWGVPGLGTGHGIDVPGGGLYVEEPYTETTKDNAGNTVTTNKNRMRPVISYILDQISLKVSTQDLYPSPLLRYL